MTDLGGRSIQHTHSPSGKSFSDLTSTSSDRVLAGTDTARDTPRPLVSILIPVYNAAANLPVLLGSIERVCYRPIQVIIVDDASTDNGIEIAEKNKVVNLVIKLGLNRGKTHAVNEGLRHASGEFVVVTDPDIIFDERLLAVWAQAMLEDRELGVAGAHVFYAEDRQRLTHSGARYLPFPPRIARLNVDVFDYGISSVPMQVPWLVIDDVYMIRRTALQLAGGFDEVAFPMMLEDADVQWRIASAGFKVQLIASARAYHQQALDGRQRFSHYTRKKLALLTRNRLTLFRRHFALEGPLLWLTAVGGVGFYTYAAFRRYSLREALTSVFPLLIRSTIDGLTVAVIPNDHSRQDLQHNKMEAKRP